MVANLGTSLGTKKITDIVIKNLKATGKEEWIRIEEELYFRIRKTGKKYFVSRYTFLGKNRKITLGEYPALKLAQGDIPLILCL